MSINDDKRELLKLKQGLIEESEIIKEEKPPKIELHGRARWENLFYHYKVPFFLSILAVFVLIFLMTDFFNRDVMDVRVLVVSSTSEANAVVSLNGDELELAFERFCPDFNNDKKVHVDAFVINMTREEYTDPNMYVANQTKLFGEMQSGVAQMLLGDSKAFSLIIGEDEKIDDFFIDLSEIYPDNPQIWNKYYFKVRGSKLANAVNWIGGCPDDMYIAIRKNSYGFGTSVRDTEKYRQQAQEILDNIVNDNVIYNVAATDK